MKLSLTFRMRRDLPYAILFLLPSLTGLLLFTLIPTLASFGLAFTDWNLLSSPRFIGVQNFREMIDDQVLWISFRNTLIYAIMIIPTSTALALVLALALDRTFRGIALFRLAFMLPGVSSLVAIAMVWKWLYNDQFGLINTALRAVGLPTVGWLTTPEWALISVVLMSLWSGMGFDAIIYLAALRNIPRHLYEAAELDGANKWQSFWKITLPLLTPIHFYNLVIGVIGAFQVFDVIFIMTQGGPQFASRVYAYHLFVEAFRRYNMGYAAAMAWFLFLIIMGLTLIQWRVVGRHVEYNY
jgi:multiple sugar transport system permease protein